MISLKKYRILYFHTATAQGGSDLSLYNLIRGLNKNLYKPIIMFNPLNTKVISYFKNSNFDVILLNRTEKDSKNKLASIEYLKQKGWIDVLRKRKIFSSIYNCMLFYRSTLPILISETKQIRQVIKERKIDLVHTNNSLSGNYPAVVAAKISNIPCICHIRGYESPSYGLNRFLSHFVDSFIFNSRTTKNAYPCRVARLNKGNVIYNAVDFDSYDCNFDTDSVRIEFGLNQNSFLGGMIGRLKEWKGQKIFLKAMEIVTREISNVDGLIVGKEDPGCEEYYQELISMTISLGLEGKVIFTGWRQDIPRLISACDVLVHCSIKPEPFGLTIIEGMAMSKPVIAANAGAPPEIITNDVDGVLVTPGDAKALANAILSICSNRTKAEAMAVRAKETVKKKFNVKRYVNEVENVYKSVLGINNED